jgi:hypothetical protein
MLIPPDTTCPNCGEPLLSAAQSDQGGVSLIVHANPLTGHLAITVGEDKELTVTCFKCNTQTPATTLAMLRAMGWKG